MKDDKIINDGGPAFPLQSGQSGVSMRDYFAAKALQGILACPEEGVRWDADIVAQNAYTQADAMLKARAQ